MLLSSAALCTVHNVANTDISLQSLANFSSASSSSRFHVLVNYGYSWPLSLGSCHFTLTKPEYSCSFFTPFFFFYTNALEKQQWLAWLSSVSFPPIHKWWETHFSGLHPGQQHCIICEQKEVIVHY